MKKLSFLRFVETFLILGIFILFGSCRENKTSEPKTTIHQTILPAEDPLKWKEDIQKLTAYDDSITYPENAVVFAGSSSIRLWESLAEDMAPIPVIRRGFGGARINDVLYWAEEIILKYNAGQVVLFAGTNDFSGNDDDNSPEYVFEKTRQLVELIHRNNPNTVIYYISITPTPLRWKVWSQAREANRLIAAYASRTENLVYLDFADQFLLPDGTPNPDFFVEDGLHLNAEGYGIWVKKLRPILSIPKSGSTHARE